MEVNFYGCKGINWEGQEYTIDHYGEYALVDESDNVLWLAAYGDSNYGKRHIPGARELSPQELYDILRHANRRPVAALESLGLEP